MEEINYLDGFHLKQSTRKTKRSKFFSNYAQLELRLKYPTNLRIATHYTVAKLFYEEHKFTYTVKNLKVKYRATPVSKDSRQTLHKKVLHV